MTQTRLQQLYDSWVKSNTPSIELLHQIMGESNCTLEVAYHDTEFLFPSRGIDQ